MPKLAADLARPAKIRQTLLGGFASSRIPEVHGERMIRQPFQPGFRIAMHPNDLGLTLQGAHSLGVALPLTAMAQHPAARSRWASMRPGHEAPENHGWRAQVEVLVPLQ